MCVCVLVAIAWIAHENLVSRRTDTAMPLLLLLLLLACNRPFTLCWWSDDYLYAARFLECAPLATVLALTVAAAVCGRCCFCCCLGTSIGQRMGPRCTLLLWDMLHHASRTQAMGSPLLSAAAARATQTMQMLFRCRGLFRFLCVCVCVSSDGRARWDRELEKKGTKREKRALNSAARCVDTETPGHRTIRTRPPYAERNNPVDVVLLVASIRMFEGLRTNEITAMLSVEFKSQITGSRISSHLIVQFQRI